MVGNVVVGVRCFSAATISLAFLVALSFDDKCDIGNFIVKINGIIDQFHPHFCCMYLLTPSMF